MKCTIEECDKHQDCGFLEILGKLKIPKSKDKCSWFKKMDARKNKSPANQSETKLGAETASENVKVHSRKVVGKSVRKSKREVVNGSTSLAS